MMSEEITPNEELVRRLNKALGWEMRALILYSHYAAYVKGIHRLHLKPFFEIEATESLGHGAEVLTEIVRVARPRSVDITRPRKRSGAMRWSSTVL